MAKKSSNKAQSTAGKSMAKVIFPVKVPLKGSYAFKQQMLPTEEVAGYLAKR